MSTQYNGSFNPRNPHKRYPFFRYCKECDKKFKPTGRKNTLCPECYEESRKSRGIWTENRVKKALESKKCKKIGKINKKTRRTLKTRI